MAFFWLQVARARARVLGRAVSRQPRRARRAFEKRHVGVLRAQRRRFSRRRALPFKPSTPTNFKNIKCSALKLSTCAPYTIDSAQAEAETQVLSVAGSTQHGFPFSSAAARAAADTAAPPSSVQMRALYGRRRNTGSGGGGSTGSSSVSGPSDRMQWMQQQQQSVLPGAAAAAGRHRVGQEVVREPSSFQPAAAGAREVAYIAPQQPPLVAARLLFPSIASSHAAHM